MVEEMKAKGLAHGDKDVSHQVTYLYGDPSKKYKDRPFCWASWGNGVDRTVRYSKAPLAIISNDSLTLTKGRFQSDIILWTFYWHLLQTGPTRSSDISREPPVGALVMVILAVSKHHTTKDMPTNEYYH